MQVSVENTGGLERKLTVQLPGEEIDTKVNDKLRELSKTVRIKGFRPGRVPMSVVRQRYGKQVREEVLGEILQKSYSDAVVQENLRPAGGPKIEADDGTDGSNFAYVATFEIMPEYLKTDMDRRVKNFRDWGIPLGRRFRALKLWFVIRHYGE